ARDQRDLARIRTHRFAERVAADAAERRADPHGSHDAGRTPAIAVRGGWHRRSRDGEVRARDAESFERADDHAGADRRRHAAVDAAFVEVVPEEESEREERP